MPTLLTLAVSFIAGLLSWSLLEYVLHRFAFHREVKQRTLHERIFGARMAKEHLEHHAKVDWFIPLWQKLAVALPIIGGVFALGMLIAAATVASGITIGLLVGWIGYELIHRWIHVAEPRNAYGRWARKHHLSHHFGNAKLNHGVSSPIWDRVFGTYAPDAIVSVPRRHAPKFPWLLDDPNAELKQVKLRDTFEGAYRLVG